MSFVCAMLLLAMIPACLQFARLAGANSFAPWGTALMVAGLALWTARLK